MCTRDSERELVALLFIRALIAGCCGEPAVCRWAKENAMASICSALRRTSRSQRPMRTETESSGDRRHCRRMYSLLSWIILGRLTKCDEGLKQLSALLSAAGRCASCGKTVPRGRNSKCAGCMHVRYCDQACQKKHWKAGHRAVCSGLG